MTGLGAAAAAVEVAAVIEDPFEVEAPAGNRDEEDAGGSDVSHRNPEVGERKRGDKL